MATFTQCEHGFLAPACPTCYPRDAAIASHGPVTSPPLHTGGPRISFGGVPFEFDEPPFQPTEPERCGISAPDLAAIIRDIARGS